MSEPEQVRTALYRLFGDGDVLLYIGIAANFGIRWQRHGRSQPWWPEVRRQTVDWHLDRDSAEDAEAEAIRTERPRYNVIHNKESAERHPLPQSPRIREMHLRHGALVRRLRRERGISQAGLAEQVQARDWPWYQTTVVRVEHGERALDFWEAVDLATVYGLSLGEFAEISKRGAA